MFMQFRLKKIISWMQIIILATLVSISFNAAAAVVYFGPGPAYGYQSVWVPGHWEYGYWVPGHYETYGYEAPGPGFGFYFGGGGHYHHHHHGHHH